MLVAALSGCGQHYGFFFFVCKQKNGQKIDKKITAPMCVKHR